MKYFDHNATTPLDENARHAWLKASSESWANPSSPHRMGAKVRMRLEAVRGEISQALGIEPDELIFCSSATEAINAWVRAYCSQSDPRPLLVSRQEHAAVIESVDAHSQGNVIYFSPHVDDLPKHLEPLIEQHQAGGVMLMAANNETGEIYPWQEVANVCNRKGIPYFCDTTQWIGKMPLGKLNQLASFCGSAHKFGGPKGVGFFKISRRFFEVKLSHGGSQEHGLRAGTEDYPAIAAMAAAFQEYGNVNAETVSEQLKFRDEWMAKLQQKMSDVLLHVTHHQVLWNTVSVAMPEKEAHYWLSKLEKAGFTVGLGAACATGKSGVSHVLNDLGVDDAIIRRTIRISGGVDTTDQDWWDLLDALEKIHTEMISQDSSGSKTEVIRI